jgi:hypothetical protein
MRWKSANPWRCWERLTLAGALNGPDDLLVRVALYDTRTRVYQSEFRWPALVRLGPNDYRGGYAQVTLRFGRIRWSFEFAAGAERSYILVRSFDEPGSSDVQIRLETLYQRSNEGEIVTREMEVIARRPHSAWRISSPSPAAHRTGSTITAPLSRPFVAVIDPAPDPGLRLEARTESERISGSADSPLTADERRAIAAVAAARRAYLDRFSFVPREFWWAYAAIPYGIGWNMIWSADRREPIQVCSRDWCVHGNYGEWVLFNWDTWLLVPAAADYDRELAHQIARPQFEVQTPEGLIPGIASPLGVSADRGMPPDASFGMLKAFLRTGDRSFVENYYDALRRYNAWWRRNRDGNGDGLLEWGSNPVKPAHPQWQAHTYWASRYETGMDNHPMWDDARYNPDTNTQEQSDIGLNALYALDCLCLAKMAHVLGRKEEAHRFEARAQTCGDLLEDRLWSDDVGLWLSRDWSGAWNQRASSCCFYPLFLPTAHPAHVERAIVEHLENPRRFGGRYVIPVSPRDDPAYPEQYYVRGRIWPGQVLLVHWALREARREQAAAALAKGCIETFRDEWVSEGHLHENYHAETADGDDTPESDPLYSFGVMLPQAAWNQLRDVRLDGSEVSTDLDVFGEYLDRGEPAASASLRSDSGAGTLRAAIDPVETLPVL